MKKTKNATVSPSLSVRSVSLSLSVWDLGCVCQATAAETYASLRVVAIPDFALPQQTWSKLVTATVIGC